MHFSRTNQRTLSRSNSEEKSVLENVIDSMGDKYSQLDINFQKTTLKLPGIPQTLELNGTVTVTVHMRSLTEEEKRASADRNVQMMSQRPTFEKITR